MRYSGSGPNVQTSIGGEQLTIVFENYTDQPEHCGDSDSGAGSCRTFPCSSSMSYTPVDLFPRSCFDVCLAAEDSWNLIPYDVPLGPGFYHYNAGILPGPGGACIFLRSPTPLRSRRTQKACSKCRKRKAKCCGSRPACTRCIVRGYVCEYVEEEKRATLQNGSRQRAYSKCSAATTDSFSECDSSNDVQRKGAQRPSTPEPSFVGANAPPPSSYRPPKMDAQDPPMVMYQHDTVVTDAYHEPPANDRYCEHSPHAEGYSYPSGASGSSQMYHYDSAIDPHCPSASPHAPHPTQSIGLPRFLKPNEQIQGAFTAMSGSDAHKDTHKHARGLQNDNDPVLPTADEAVPQMSLLQAPLIPSSIDPTLESHIIEYAQSQNTPYYLATGESDMQLPYLQYQYAVPIHLPTWNSQDDTEVAPDLYAMPMSMLLVNKIS